MTMESLRPINLKIGNLRGHRAMQVRVDGQHLAIQFEPVASEQEMFCIRLGGVLEYVDRGLVQQPLTAGIVWKPVGSFGREAALRLEHNDLAGLIELRIDDEENRILQCRFQAVACAAMAWNGSFWEAPASSLAS